MQRKILYVQYTNPACYPSLEHSSHILAENNWQVLFLGTWAFSGNTLNFRPHFRININRIFFCPEGWFQKIHYLLFCLWVIGWTILWRPQWIYSSDPLSCPLSWLLSYLPGVKIIYHEHDSPSLKGNESRFMKLVFWMRRKIAVRSKTCIFPNETRKKQFINAVDSSRSVVTVWNCPRYKEAISEHKSRVNNFLHIIYEGSVSPDRLQTNLFKALSILPPVVEFKIIGYETAGAKGYIRELHGLSKRLGISTRVKFLGEMSRGDVFRRCKETDVGFCLIPMNSDDVNFKYMVGASVKTFDYLACGLALLVSDLPDWRKMYVEPGYGLACNPNDPESIANSLKWFLEHPKEMREMGESGRQKILSEWNYESQFAPIRNLINQKI